MYKVNEIKLKLGYRRLKRSLWIVHLTLVYNYGSAHTISVYFLCYDNEIVIYFRYKKKRKIFHNKNKSPDFYKVLPSVFSLFLFISFTFRFLTKKKFTFTFLHDKHTLNNPKLPINSILPILVLWITHYNNLSI